MYQPVSPPSSPLAPSVFHLPPSPSTPLPSPFTKGQVSNGLVQSMLHQIEADPRSSLYIGWGQTIQQGKRFPIVSSGPGRS